MKKLKALLLAKFNKKSLKDRLRLYSDPANIMHVLEEEVGISFNNIKHKVSKANITLTPEQVQDYLDNIDMSAAYDPAVLQHFNKKVNILKDKSTTLLSLIEDLANRDYAKAQPMIDALDLHIDRYGYIADIDAKRLMVPTMSNLYDLKKTVHQGNQLSTYLMFKMPYEEIKNGTMTMDDLYPCAQLQTNNFGNDEIAGNVPLSSKQITKLENLAINAIDSANHQGIIR